MSECAGFGWAKKVMVVGVDGLDPRFSKKMMDAGRMPNMAQLVKKGAAREDLVLLGAVPTITPPLWTTLATGAYPATHGITCFWRQDLLDLGKTMYNLDSRLSTAEPIWNVLVESGKKTLVWHWPGSSWPPTSDNPLLSVVDGTQPAAVNKGGATVDGDKIIFASKNVPDVMYVPQSINDSSAGCIIEDLETYEEESRNSKVVQARKRLSGSVKVLEKLQLSLEDGEIASLGQGFYGVVNSPIKEAKGWAFAPEDAKEFYMIISNGLERRPCLILKNKEGIYDQVALYKSKKADHPLAVGKVDEMVVNLVDEVKKDDRVYQASRHMKVLEIAPDGSQVRVWLSGALDIGHDGLFHPTALYHQVVANVGYIPAISTMGGINQEYVEKLFLKGWDIHVDWQADALTYLARTGQYDVIMSHIHNVDNCGHQLWHYAKHQTQWGNKEAIYQGYMAYIYEQTDRYLGKFLPLLDEGWTIMITSDHGLIVTEEEPPIIGEAGGISVRVMEELGFTVLKRDTQGKELPEIDWSKTRAVASRGDHIFINLKGRNTNGIVQPADQYALEQQIIDALYNYREEKTGKRVIAIALRNKDALLLGMGGPECGDIIYFLEEGFNRIHGDSLSTHKGYFDSSVSPIFIGAGPGIKANYTIERMIRQVDVAPTIATLLGVRMPAQCEGAPMYQLFEA